MKNINNNKNKTQAYNSLLKKITNNSINILPLNRRPDNRITGRSKYLPSFTKEWKNIIYSYNKNTLRNIPINYFNINKIISSYFKLYFKNWKFIGDQYNIFMKKRIKYLNRIYISNPDIKYTNNKAMITLYLINGEKYRTYKKYRHINRHIRNIFINKFIQIYKNLPKKLHYLMLNNLANKYIFIKSLFTKKTVVKYKLNYLNKLTKLNYYYIKKIWVIIEKKYVTLEKTSYNAPITLALENQEKQEQEGDSDTSRKLGRKFYLLRRYQLMYTLNQYKFNKSKFLPSLSNYLQQLIGKKIEYNFVKLKSISLNTDIMTKFVALKMLKKKNTNFLDTMSLALNTAEIPTDVKFFMKSSITRTGRLNPFLTKFKDSKLISNFAGAHNDINNLIQNAYFGGAHKNAVFDSFYNSINYKNVGGLMLQLSGRLSKRYRADRSRRFLEKTGVFKNHISSYKKLGSILYRGNNSINLSFSSTKSKRRIGSFAVKGWIAGKNLYQDKDNS